MLRRLVLAPAVAFLAIGTTATPADAQMLCIQIDLIAEFDLSDLPGFVPAYPKTACVPLPIDTPVTIPPIG